MKNIGNLPNEGNAFFFKRLRYILNKINKQLTKVIQNYMINYIKSLHFNILIKKFLHLLNF